MKNNVVIVIPNWNGAELLPGCLDSLQNQTKPCDILVVDNGSTDKSVEIIKNNYGDVRLIELPRNKGFAGGVNEGIQSALSNNYEYIGLLNTDARPGNDWVKKLVQALEVDEGIGSAMGLMVQDNDVIDSSGDCFSMWGLTFARQRGEDVEQAEASGFVFGTSAGACIYKKAAIREVGGFDDDFFAYYEDTDLNLRLQLKGWRSYYVREATVHHAIGGTSKKIKGLTTYQTLKNLPWLVWKNLPFSVLIRVLPRFTVAYVLIFLSSIAKGKGWYALKGLVISLLFLPKKIAQRYVIQKSKTVTNSYLISIIYSDMPPKATSLRRFRKFFVKKSYRQ